MTDCFVREEVDITIVELDARLDSHRCILVEPLQLERHTVRASAQTHTRDQLALCITMPASMWS